MQLLTGGPGALSSLQDDRAATRQMIAGIWRIRIYDNNETAESINIKYHFLAGLGNSEMGVNRRLILVPGEIFFLIMYETQLPFPSFPRRRESSDPTRNWIPACAGMTNLLNLISPLLSIH